MRVLRSHGSRRWHRSLILYISLVMLAVVTQFGIGWYQRHATARSRLSQWAEGVGTHIAYSQRWDLTRLRQAELSAATYFVPDRHSLSIDTGLPII